MIGLVEFLGNEFDLPEELGFVLFVEQDPVLYFGRNVQGMEAVDGLVEVVADVVEFFAEFHHVGQKVIDGLVAVAFDDGLSQQDLAAVLAEGAGGGLLLEGFELPVFFFAHPDGEPFGAMCYGGCHGCCCIF